MQQSPLLVRHPLLEHPLAVQQRLLHLWDGSDICRAHSLCDERAQMRRLLCRGGCAGTPFRKVKQDASKSRVLQRVERQQFPTSNDLPATTPICCASRQLGM